MISKLLKFYSFTGEKVKLIKITIEKILNGEEGLTIDQDVFVQFGCSGKLEYSIEEKRVDEILGEKAFCGGELDDELYEVIEKEMENESFPSYFWTLENEELVDNFKKYLEKQSLPFNVEFIEKEDWNENWRKNFNEIVVNENFKVVPSWEKKGKGDDVFIYPGMGFGTGNHETTFLCLKEYLELNINNEGHQSCLDFGCGSGILGIAAMKKGFNKIDFVDIDVEALDNCVINLELNNHLDYDCEKGVILRDRFKVESLDEKYDLVFANILENVLELEKELLLQALKDGGYLIVSGLLNEQVENIKKQYSGALQFVKVASKGDWSAIVFQK